MHRKPYLPEKICATCGRPFTWRAKWKQVWEEVRYCSERCRRGRRASPDQRAGQGPPRSPGP